MSIPDSDGNVWAPYVNAYEQRKLRCVSGPRMGDEIDDARADPPPVARTPRARYVGEDPSIYDD